jgi:hypothetical protein
LKAQIYEDIRKGGGGNRELQELVCKIKYVFCLVFATIFFIFTQRVFSCFNNKVIYNMTLQKAFFSIFYSALLCFTACDRPECRNQNPIFDNYLPDSQPYKTELVKQLNSMNCPKLRYWLAEYESKNGQICLYCFVQGDGLCAKLPMLVKDNQQKLEGVIHVKGNSYRGAEFKNLTFDIVQNGNDTEFIYKNLDKIID